MSVYKVVDVLRNEGLDSWICKALKAAEAKHEDNVKLLAFDCGAAGPGRKGPAETGALLMQGSPPYDETNDANDCLPVAAVRCTTPTLLQDRI
jgi:hypothetical protein